MGKPDHAQPLRQNYQESRKQAPWAGGPIVQRQGAGRREQAQAGPGRPPCGQAAGGASTPAPSAAAGPDRGPPTLFAIGIQLLIKWRSCLGDIGATPVELLHDILAACGPAELASIEDDTREYSTRDLGSQLETYWRNLYESRFGRPAPALHGCRCAAPWLLSGYTSPVYPLLAVPTHPRALAAG